jgi:hypothetical protein
MTHRILIIGAGNVGAALGKSWLKAGHDVRFGVPDPDHPRYSDLPKDRMRPAADRGDAQIIVLAVPFGAAVDAVRALGDLSGTILIDCTNPLGSGPEGMRLTIGHDRSGAETVAAAANGASVFKTLNQSGAENMGDPSGYSPKPVMFVAGDDSSRKPVVMGLVEDLGFEAVDAGRLTAARLLEPLAMLWISLALEHGLGRDMAFALLRRNAG